MSVVVKRTVSLEAVPCNRCGVMFGITTQMYDARVEDKEEFYCPNGHSLAYPGKSDRELRLEAEQAKREALALADQRLRDLNGALDAAAKVKREAKAATERVENGVCPHCHRTFKALARHMHSKHGVENGAEAVDALAAKVPA